jgi:hypothetical protein
MTEFWKAKKKRKDKRSQVRKKLWMEIEEVMKVKRMRV